MQTVGKATGKMVFCNFLKKYEDFSKQVVQIYTKKIVLNSAGSMGPYKTVENNNN